MWFAQARVSWIVISGLMINAMVSSVTSASPHQDHHEDAAAPGVGRRVAATAYTLVPGLLISGGGHWITGESMSAERLFWIKIGGWAGILSGGAIMARSGASPVVTPWATPLLILSGTAIVSSSVLDAVGVWSDTRRSKERQTPPVQAAPLTRGRGAQVFEAGLSSRRSSFAPVHLLTSLRWSHQLGRYAYAVEGGWGDQQGRYQAHVERRLSVSMGWAIWTRLGYTAHLHERARFTLQQGEFTLRSTLRLGRLIGPSLSSMSGAVAVGWSGGAFVYDGEEIDQVTGVLGMFRLTHHSLSDRLRFSVSYDHRHDGWVGGAIVPGLGSGILGSISGMMSGRIARHVWVEARAMFGAAHIYTVALNWAR